jgi:cytoskeletal protein CcmA (bactofilin family)
MDTSDIGTSIRGRGRRGAASAAPSDVTSAVTLGPRDSLVGTLTVDGDVRIEGSLQGDVSATGEVNVHDGATVRAQIGARDIVVTGNVDGNIVAEQLVSIGDTAVITGEIRAARLRIDEGAHVNAVITMGPSGDAPPARHMDEHDEEGTVDVIGSPVDEASDQGAYPEVSAGSDSDAYSDERSAETAAVSSGSDSDEG